MERWMLDSNVEAYHNSKDVNASLNGVLNALAMQEADAIQYYSHAKTCIDKISAEQPDKGAILNKMLDQIIEQKNNHDASIKKAAAICGGLKPPKPDAYDKAVKNE